MWDKFDEMVNSGQIVSVREVLNEIKARDDRLTVWASARPAFFPEPNAMEQKFVSEIFLKQEFQHLIREQERLSGKPVADPFVIASARVGNGCVVTEEVVKETGAKIPNVCRHFGIKCVNLEQFMENEGWVF